jgi:ribulose-5-phosphate 4-epimerase/fuculose-1-phosphate aldolase
MYIVLLSYSISDAGAVIHTHSKHAVMATLLYPGTEFRITHQEMIKGIQKNKSGKYKCMIFIYSASNIYIYIYIYTPYERFVSTLYL